VAVGVVVVVGFVVVVVGVFGIVVVVVGIFGVVPVDVVPVEVVPVVGSCLLAFDVGGSAVAWVVTWAADASARRAL
jgi:hypothetical protein